MDIGKAAMSIHLVGCEQVPKIFGEPNGFNWLKYLFRRMQGGSFEVFGDNKVSFVTFNYDRVIE
jgi:hypothetical protein